MSIDDYCTNCNLDPAIRLSQEDNWKELSQIEKQETSEAILKRSNSVSSLHLSDIIGILKVAYDPSRPSRNTQIPVNGNKLLYFYNEALEKAETDQNTFKRNDEGYYSKEAMGERTALLLRFKGALLIDLYSLGRKTNKENFELLNQGINSLEKSLTQNYNNPRLRAETYVTLASGLENEFKFKPGIRDNETLRKRWVKKMVNCYSTAIQVLTSDEKDWSCLISKYQSKIAEVESLKEKIRKNKGNIKTPKRHKQGHDPRPVSRAAKRKRAIFGRN
ncbi:MAG: hypothetical protein KAQ83_00890 [Nanoarchaeota archaeon]|nr:hypothetical protein [Nanoarchaeota archaeon]